MFPTSAKLRILGEREFACSEPQNNLRPLTILIAALGGEGGGVLTDWIVAAAASQNFPVQSTSIPGVAQRTGATTYHIELVPGPHPSLPRKRGRVREGAPGPWPCARRRRCRSRRRQRIDGSRPRHRLAGYITPDRTMTIASLSRSYLVTERMAMGDGRYDHDKLVAAVEKNSQKDAAARSRSDRARVGRDDQCGDARHYRRHRRLADPGRGVRGGDPRRRQGGEC